MRAQALTTECIGRFALVATCFSCSEPRPHPKTPANARSPSSPSLRVIPASNRRVQRSRHGNRLAPLPRFGSYCPHDGTRRRQQGWRVDEKAGTQRTVSVGCSCVSSCASKVAQASTFVQPATSKVSGFPLDPAAYSIRHSIRHLHGVLRYSLSRANTRHSEQPPVRVPARHPGGGQRGCQHSALGRGSRLHPSFF